MKTIFIDVKDVLVNFDMKEQYGQIGYYKDSFKYLAKLLKNFENDFYDNIIVFLYNDTYGEEVIKNCIDVLNKYCKYFTYCVYWKSFDNNNLNDFMQNKNSNPLLAWTDDYVIIAKDLHDLMPVYLNNKDFLKHFVCGDPVYGFTKDQYKQAKNILKGKVNFGKIWKV